MANASVQKQFFRSILNNIVMNALQLKISNTTTFAQMLELGKEYIDATNSRFDYIQPWLNHKQDKDEPVSSFMEHLTELAKKIEIDRVTSNKWMFHLLHQTLSQQVLKGIKLYLDPGIKFDKATV